MKAIVISLFSLFWLVAGGTVGARTPFPDYTGQPVTVVDVPDSYRTLTTDIERIQRDSPRTYYIVVISNSGTGTWATRNYIDELYERWRAQAAQKEIPLDPNRSVLILLATENRQLSMHAGSVLQNEYGLRGQTIDREIVQPHFIPHAKAGNYAEGLRVLLAETEQWLNKKEAEKRRAAELAAARAAAIQRDAESTLESVKELIAEARQEIDDKRASGLMLDPFAERTRQAQQQLTELESLLPRDPPQVLQQGGHIQKDLRGAVDQIRRLATIQRDAQKRLEEVSQRAVRSEKSVDAVRRQNLAIDPVHAELVAALDALQQARELIDRDPRTALHSIQQVSQRLDSIDADVKALPRLKQQVDESRTEAATLLRQVTNHLGQVEELGGDVEAVKAKLADVQAHLEDADSQRETNYRLALATIHQPARQLRNLDSELQAIAAGHVFRTRTLPIIIASCAAGLAALILLVLIVRHSRLKKAVRKRLAEIKRRAVALSDRYDALKQQHQYLPFSDTDFKEPMQGTTLSVYDQIDDNLGRIRAHWLSLMELAERIEGLVALESIWSTKRLCQARELAQGVPDLDVRPLDQDCVTQLARLEQAHEDAQAGLQKVQLLRTRIGEQLEAVQEANLAGDPYHSDLKPIEESVAAGQSILVADPLEAQVQLDQVRERCERLQDWLGTVLENSQALGQLRSQLEDVVSQSVQHRASGLKLIEEGGNPDRWLSEARLRLEEAGSALDQGNVVAAEGLLGSAATDVGHADEVMRRVASAKAFCETEIPARRSESDTLADALRQAQEARDVLREGYAEESWRNVADNVSQATELLSALAPMTDRAADLASLEVQHYFRAADTLRTIQVQQQGIAALADAVEGRLQELKELSGECRSLSDKNLEDVRRARKYIQQHDPVVRADARSLLDRAERAQEVSERTMEADRVHWPAAWRGLDSARVAVAEALEEATEDVRCHGELRQKLESALVAARRVDDFLRSQTADRPRANRQYQAARQSIEAIQRQCAEPCADWSLLLRRLTEADEDIAGAERLAKQDIQLARQANDSLLAATRLYEQARSYYRHGISTDVGRLASELEALQRQLQAQNFEQVIEQAESAARAAREAYDDAVERARKKQRRLDRERRRRAAARRAASRSFLSGPSVSSSFGSSRSFSGSSSSSFSSGSSSSSFSRGSSQSSW